MTWWAELVLCREQKTVHRMGSAPARRPAADGGCYANESFVGLRGFEPELILERLARPSELVDLSQILVLVLPINQL